MHQLTVYHLKPFIIKKKTCLVEEFPVVYYINHNPIDLHESDKSLLPWKWESLQRVVLSFAVAKY